jgi:trehalose 6-phosphate synthase/phosphatase
LGGLVETKPSPLDAQFVKKRFHESKKRLICLDYDGTLRKFEKTPPEAFPSQSLLDVLSTLAKRPNTTLGIISGRDSKDLEGWFKDPNIYLIGDHGTRIRGKNGSWESLITYKIEDRDNLFNEFEKYFKNIDSGYIFEKKETSFGVNCRGISE